MDSELSRIYGLKYQLLTLGYAGTQVDIIVRNVIGPAIPEEVDEALRKRLVAELEYYLAAAGKYVRN